MLFTSHKALKRVASDMAHQLDFPILVQGHESKAILLSKFRQLGNAVLLGTGTFWEGVDVKGEALTCVIIDKLPFPNPSDPIIQGKAAHYEAKGLSGFEALALPTAALTLKQGAGRLIRDEQDRGVLMIVDPRLTAREYGRAIMLSLPPMKKTRDEGKVLAFIEGLGLSESRDGLSLLARPMSMPS
jgi:ATP-dependent DNA helicase DinG